MKFMRNDDGTCDVMGIDIALPIPFRKVFNLCTSELRVIEGYQLNSVSTITVALCSCPAVAFGKKVCYADRRRKAIVGVKPSKRTATDYRRHDVLIG